MNTINPISYKTISHTFGAVKNKRLMPELLRDTVEISGRGIENNKAKAAGISAVIASLLCAKNQDDKKTPTLDECMIARDSGNLDEYKKMLVPFLESIDCDEDYIDLIANSNNREDIDLWINSTVDIYLHNNLNNAIEELNIMERIENRDFDDELNKKLAENERFWADRGSAVAKLSSKPDTNEEVKQIKAELNKKYNLKGLFLNNDLEFAKACSEALEILKQNNITYNGTIIAANGEDFAGVCLNSSDGSCVIINPDSWQRSMSLKHTVIHEIIHSLQPATLDFRTQIIPEEYKTTADNVSEYAKDNLAHEVHCELYVKKLLHGLNPKEEELFNLLGGNFLKTDLAK